jgi:Ni2+-binding GTPase involved in maturation of urease and hydrogenase
MPVFEISAKTGQGLEVWIDWLTEQVNAKLSG